MCSNNNFKASARQLSAAVNYPKKLSLLSKYSVALFYISTFFVAYKTVQQRKIIQVKLYTLFFFLSDFSI